MTSIAFPFTINASGGVATRTDRISAANDRILNVLMTMPYERPMRAVFGGGIPGVLFDTMDNDTISEVHDRVTNAIRGFVSEIQLRQVRVVPDTSSEGRLNIEVYYTLSDEIDGQLQVASLSVGETTETTF